MSLPKLEKCISKLGIYFKPLITNDEEKIKILQLLYQYYY